MQPLAEGPQRRGYALLKSVTTLQDAGFQLGTTRYGFTSNSAPDTVARQDPAAESALTTFSLHAAITQDCSTVVEKGLVILQVPLAGALMDPGDMVAKDTVINQGPAGGAKAAAGSTVLYRIERHTRPARIGAGNPARSD